MAVWNTQYKSNPPDDNNPGYGATAIRDLKSNLEDIIGNEHSMDFDETSAHGQHQPGSAICDYTNGSDDDDDYIAVDNGQVGRLTTTTTTEYNTDGDDWDKTNIKVYTFDGYLDIVGKDQVSNYGDETINGEKIFTTAPIIPTMTEEEIEDAEDGTIATIAYVQQETTPINIELSDEEMYMGSDQNVNLYTFSDTATELHTIPAGTSSSELDTLLTAIQTELANLRSALVAVAAMSPYDQDLGEEASPEFAGLTVDGTISADIVYGAVWG